MPMHFRIIWRPQSVKITIYTVPKLQIKFAKFMKVSWLISEKNTENSEIGQK